jgi:hypothetical protein
VFRNCPGHYCAGTLPRPLFVPEDCPDHCLNNGFPWLHVICTHIQLRDISFRPRLGDFIDHPPTTAWGLRCSFLDLRSGTASITLRPRLGDFVDHSSTTARGLCVSTTCDWRLAYSWDILSRLDPATRLIPRLPASSGTTLIRCTCRCISYRLYDGWILNLTGNSF